MSAASETPILLVHGFAQTPKSWQTVIQMMAGGRPLHAIELPGHGATALSKGEPSVSLVRDYVTDRLDDQLIERAIVWGYSQGARVALDLALERPERVAGLIVESGTAGIDDPHARADRRSRDFALSKRIENSTIEQFVKLWEIVPALTDQSRELINAQRDDRSAHDPVALAAAMRGIGQSAYEPMWPRLGQIDVPALVISGGRDRIYNTLGERLAAAMPDARHEIVAAAGHSVHLERPREAVAAVERFLQESGL